MSTFWKLSSYGAQMSISPLTSYHLCLAFGTVWNSCLLVIGGKTWGEGNAYLFLANWTLLWLELRYVLQYSRVLVSFMTQVITADALFMTPYRSFIPDTMDALFMTPCRNFIHDTMDALFMTPFGSLIHDTRNALFMTPHKLYSWHDIAPTLYSWYQRRFIYGTVPRRLAIMACEFHCCVEFQARRSKCAIHCNL